jgi:DnaJ-class molecular chaperone
LIFSSSFFQASLADIRDAYRKMAAIYHPDKVRANASINLQVAAQTWQQLNEAKYHLFDEVRRKFYDIKIGAVDPTTTLVQMPQIFVFPNCFSCLTCRVCGGFPFTDLRCGALSSRAGRDRAVEHDQICRG